MASKGKNLLSSLLASALLAELGTTIAVPQHATPVNFARVAQTSYDFVIAGAGIAGLTVADRLTEDPKVSVLVIEAGPFDKGEPEVYVPGIYAPFAYFEPGLASTPQTALNNRVFPIAAGRVVGGGSTVNAMVYLRGAKGDYDDWENLGSPGWGWDDLFPFFLKSENFTRPDPAFAAVANISYDDSVRGHKGPVQYSYPNYYYPGSANWWNAASSTGLKPIKDPEAGANVGLFWFPTAVDAKTRTRNDARNNHYDRVQPRANYHILTDHLVSKVLFDQSVLKRAIGVECVPTANGTAQTILASKEVILAAGAIHTPQILQLSGVGPKKLLNSLGVPVVVDLPGVGTNLQDQALVKPTYNFSHQVFSNADSLMDNATYNAEQFNLYLTQQKGAYTIVRTLSTNFAETSFALACSANSAASYNAAATGQDASSSLPSGTDPTVLQGYRAQRAEVLRARADPRRSIGGMHWTTASTVILYHFAPLSRGTITASTTDIRVPPVIDFRCATDPADLDLSVALVRKAREVMNAPPMQPLGPSANPPFPPSGVQGTDAQLIAAIRGNMEPSNAHQCCTAPMMPRKLGGVVDNNLKVYGVKGLRVIDISFWPMQIAGAPTATMYATGEKIADTIKKEYLLAEYAS